jgi:hypothetical protein
VELIGLVRHRRSNLPACRTQKCQASWSFVWILWARAPETNVNLTSLERVVSLWPLAYTDVYARRLQPFRARKALHFFCELHLLLTRSGHSVIALIDGFWWNLVRCYFNTKYSLDLFFLFDNFTTLYQLIRYGMIECLQIKVKQASWLFWRRCSGIWCEKPRGTSIRTGIEPQRQEPGQWLGVVSYVYISEMCIFTT